MSIQKQITYTFIIFAAVISIIVGSIYGILYSRNYRNIIYAQLEERASVSVQQMSDIIWQMSLANQVLLSNQDVLNSIRRLSKYDMSEGSYENLYFSTAFSTIRSELNSYFNYENYYRIVFFNRTGVVISPSNTLADAMDLNINYEDLPWLDLVQEGNSVLIPCHLDDWGRNKAVVLSLVSGLVGNNMGYIEVQWLKEDLDQYLEPSDEESNVLFYNLDGELIYSYKDSPGGGGLFFLHSVGRF